MRAGTKETPTAPPHYVVPHHSLEENKASKTEENRYPHSGIIHEHPFEYPQPMSVQLRPFRAHQGSDCVEEMLKSCR